MSESIDRLRSYVETLLVSAGFVVLDIVTHDMDPEDGETEWIVMGTTPRPKRLLLSNNFGALIASNEPRAKDLICREIEHLKTANAIWRSKPDVDIPD